ncbi:MAG: DUF2853 family protein [Planctomycetota bacterium]
MSKLEDAIESCKTQMKAQKIPCNDELLTAIAKSLGPSLYNRDARTVATGQKAEMQTIRKKFLIGKLKCEDTPALDKAIDSAIEKIGRSNRSKLRPVFYYLLVKSLKKESVYV